MPESTIQLSFPVRQTESGLMYVAHDHADSAIQAKSNAKGKDKLRAMFALEIDAALRVAKHTQQRVLVCNDGTVLVLRFKSCSWQYDIAGPDHVKRGYGSAVSGFQTQADAREAAYKHAEVWGGVKWEVST